ncbi:LEAF RUST 10 DISEASE-RESISTANCE LOCUS RECEPTOR-LIKE PROTEIN KINASE-like 1.4 [Syzygium oleosum]|uniref:LEAF RUST 10 DISEASE-RESISTANCE LOCUS RECEPTOR-LIKE PROTEIN KINASE-like 1.4 n=1 Tax=Syzygium oleosum TaxID=219896 RepID=UPI0011D24F96|nr:LEAF RUST 10 DISEASE-RESISTANCE LOCUS RECEPTOR-LIKE PROTEIN KINASE-like 1.4 [Syzygium oleosum]
MLSLSWAPPPPASSSLVLHLLFPLFLILIKTPRSLGEDYYSSCTEKFSCGDVVDVGYPFWGGSRASFCGYPQLELKCENGSTATIVIQEVKYRVLGVYPDPIQVLRIARDDYMQGLCSTNFLNTTLDSSLFQIAYGYTNFTLLYGCQTVVPLFSCPVQGVPYTGGYYVLSGLVVPIGSCFKSVVVPLSLDVWSTLGNSSSNLVEVLQHGFEVQLKVDGEACGECTQSFGVCGYDLATNQTTCYCPGQSFGSKTCGSSISAAPPEATTAKSTQGKKDSKSLSIGLGIGGAGFVGILLGFLFVCLVRRKKKKAAFQIQTKDLGSTPSNKSLLISSNFTRSIPSFPSLKSDLEKGSTYFGVKVFEYVELEEATQNFDPSRELGDGGFGTVYYGELRDGRVVAVKRLYENNLRRVEQFMNEVEILTRLHHQNLVKLYGCTSRRSRELLLVYEYIPNGTVADHLYGTRASSNLLPWRVRLKIAIETADALTYLHASDVIHRDVKTNNILLENNFCVKVADFGLSRLFPTDVSHISTAPQGTPGYVDPEYYQCYQLTDKSDVYSFGVVLCELLSSKPAVDTNRHRQDINLANMAVNRIQNRTLHELIDTSLGFETDYAVRRMMTFVAELAFRCLQDERDMRPTMEEVLDTLKRIGTAQIEEQKAEVMDEVLDTLRGFQYENARVKKAEVIDIRSDEVGLLKNMPPLLSPDSVVSPNWGSNPTTPNSI